MLHLCTRYSICHFHASLHFVGPLPGEALALSSIFR